MPRNSETPERLITWSALLLHVSGRRFAEIAGEVVRQKNLPLSRFDLTFSDGALVVDAVVRKFIPLPVRVVVKKIELRGNNIYVKLDELSAFSFVPLPEIVLSIASRFAKPGEVEFRARERDLVIRVDRFLPSFVDVEIDSIRIVSDGFEVIIGPGGADPPAIGGLNDRVEQQRANPGREP